MDLSFGRFERHAAEQHQLPGGLAVLLAVVSARQAASVTARLHARLAHAAIGVPQPAWTSGAFNPRTAAALAAWARA